MADSIANRRPKRDGLLTCNLQELINKKDQLLNDVNAALTSNLSPILNDAIGLKSYASDLKLKLAEYGNVTYILQRRLVQTIGSKHEAEEIRQERERIRLAVENTIDSCNDYLQDLETTLISSLDWQSVISRKSFTSKKSVKSDIQYSYHHDNRSTTSIYDCNVEEQSLINDETVANTGMIDQGQYLPGPEVFGANGSDQSSIRVDSTIRFVADQTVNPYRDSDSQGTRLQDEPVPSDDIQVRQDLDHSNRMLGMVPISYDVTNTGAQVFPHQPSNDLPITDPNVLQAENIDDAVIQKVDLISSNIEANPDFYESSNVELLPQNNDILNPNHANLDDNGISPDTLSITANVETSQLGQNTDVGTIPIHPNPDDLHNNAPRFNSDLHIPTISVNSPVFTTLKLVLEINGKFDG